MTEKQYLSWEEFEGAVWSIAETVDSQFRYGDVDIVTGIARGGLAGAVMLSHALDARLQVARADHYDDEEQQDEVIIESFGMRNVGDGDSVLLFDDIVDTGKTLSAVTHEWETQGVVDFDFQTAAIHVKPDRDITPDYWIEETEKWVVYPWEVSL
jgi:hypoxanthine phosphoribosyltransferase